MKRVGIIGCGYVGLVTGACLAQLGHSVVCADKHSGRIEMLERGELPFYEPGLAEIARENVRARRLRFSADIDEAIRGSEIVFIAVGTPMRADGRADLSAVQEAARHIARVLDGPKIVVLKSTVPVTTGEQVEAIISECSAASYRVDIVSNPEFLREGCAVADFMKPDRIVLGVSNSESERIMRELYAAIDAPVFVTDVRASEMIKYVANAFLATKVSFINEIANICELLDVDVTHVSRGLSYDPRIGHSFLNPGIGYGGSCLPKDVSALEHLAMEYDYAAQLLHAVAQVNHRQTERLVMKLERGLGGLRGNTVCVLGLAFKPNTDDLREAPALALVRRLLDRRALVHAYDPVAGTAARAHFGSAVSIFDDPYLATEGAHAVIVATEWSQIKALDLGRVARAMAGDLLIDGRNAMDPDSAASAGLRYVGVGRFNVSAAFERVRAAK